MTYTFELSKPLADYGRTLRDWSTAYVRPHARQADTQHAPPENWREILDGCPVPIGRVDLPEPSPLPDFEEGFWVSNLVMYENLNYGDLWPLALLNTNIGHLVVDAMGTPEQIERWYKPAIEEGQGWAFALTEPGFGSDTSQVATTATRDGDTWILNGSKIYCSNGASADFISVFATTDKALGPKGIHAFVVPRDTPGCLVAKANEDKLGVRSWLTSEMVFDNCVIPVENQLGWSPDGQSGGRTAGRGGALATLSHNRPNMSAIVIGLAQASIDVTTDLLTERRLGFTPRRWSAATDDLALMNASLQRARRMNARAQFLVDQGNPNPSASAAAKAYAPETAERVIARCMQLLGPDGYSQDLLLEKWYRDAKIIDIFEGTGQIQRIVVARSLMGRLAG